MRFFKYIILQPSVVIAAIVLSFGCVAFLFQYYEYNTKQLLIRNAEAHQLVAKWETLLSCTKDLLISDDLKNALQRWKYSISDFDHSIRQFVQSDFIDTLIQKDARLRDRVEDTKNLWDVMKPRIESVQVRFEEYMAQGPMGNEVTKRSLLHELLYQMEQNSRSTEYVKLFDLTYDIEYMVSSLSSYFLDTMNMMVEMLTITMAHKTKQLWLIASSSFILIFVITVLFLIVNQRALARTTNQLHYLSSQLIEAEERERKRIAQELHDEIGQALTGIKFAVDNANNLVSHGNIEEGITALEHVEHLIRNAIDEARRLSVSLRPAMIDQLGIIATMSWYCREYQKIYSHISIRQHIVAEEKDIPNHLKIILYRILQETLTNVAKHSNAEQVLVLLHRHEKALMLTIQDNGIGFEKRHVQADAEYGGFGLLSLRERVELSGGEFSVQSEKGKGTKITSLWKI